MKPDDIKRLIQQEVQKQMSSANPAFTKALDQYVSQKTYLLPKVVPHKHDGVDNIKINAQNVVPNNKYVAFITITAGGGDVTINGITNPSQVLFYGIARNPVSGIVTYKAQLFGNAQLGNCFQEQGGISGISPAYSLKIPSPTIQIGSCTFFDGFSGAWIPHVNEDQTTNNFIVLFDSSANLVASATIKSFTNTSIVLSTKCDAGWLVEGSIIIT